MYIFRHSLYAKLLASVSMYKRVVVMSKELSGFDARLTEKMAESGVTQADLCRLTGLASSMVSHYCTGQRVPSVPVAANIARALNTTIDYLASGSKPQPKNRYSSRLAVAEEEKPYSPKRQPHGAGRDACHEGETLEQLFLSLNETGQEKVIEYIRDLLSTGRYE